MDFGLSSEQQQLADAERSWLTRNDPIPRARAMLDSSPVTLDPNAVSHAAGAGLLALLTPEVNGGHVDLAVLAEAHGYAASSLPIADLAIAAWLLGVSGAPQAPAAAEGEALFGLTRAPATLTGLSSPVPMAADMTGVVVVGETDEGDYLSVVTNPRLDPMSTLDLSRSWARVGFDPSETGRLPLPSGTAGFVRDALAVHRGMDALGAASRLLEMTVVYAGQRQQFGVPIGSFQAVQHKMADMHVAIERARALSYFAALTISADDPRRRLAAAMAKASAGECQALVFRHGLQSFGAMGFTWENDVQFALKRAKAGELMLGGAAEHRAMIAEEWHAAHV